MAFDVDVGEGWVNGEHGHRTHGACSTSVRDHEHCRSFAQPSPTLYLHPRKHLAHSMVLEWSLSSRGTDEPCRSFTHVDAGPSRSIATPQHHVVISILPHSMVSTPRNVVSPEHGVSTPMLRASPEHGLRIISFITGLTNNAVPSRSIATPQHHVVISIATPQHGLNPT